MTNKTSVALLALLGALLAARSVSADGGPSPGIGNLVQIGQDVRMNVSIPEIHMDNIFRLLRYDENHEYVVVLEDHSFSEDDAVGTTTNEDFWGDEYLSYLFEVTDECVPPGWYEYWITDGAPSLPITVDDTGDPCLSGDGGVDAGDGENSDEGCSVTGIGSDATAGALGLLMLGIGFAGLFVSRRRQSRRAPR